MRLAAEYQQRSKKQDQKEENGRKYIVRLGKGLPNQQKRKRGISISQADSNISEQSLGKNEVSVEKQRQQVLASQKKTFASSKQAQEKILVSVATYVSNPQKMNGYAAQHLFDVKHKESEIVASKARYLSGVKSHQNLINRQNNHFAVDTNVSKIVPSQISNAIYIPQKMIPINEQRHISRQHKNLVKVNSRIIQNPSNLTVYQTKPLQNHQAHLFMSNPSMKQLPPPKTSQIRMKSGEPIKICIPRQHKSQDKTTINNSKHQSVKQQLVETTRNTQKIISSQRTDPYNLSRLKVTKKNEDYETVNEQLKETKKYLKGLPECKQASSSNASSDYKSNILFSRAGIISLWDANKVESILSMKESRQIKVQQSQIMQDYFNPSESMLKNF